MARPRCDNWRPPAEGLACQTLGEAMSASLLPSLRDMDVYSVDDKDIDSDLIKKKEHKDLMRSLLAIDTRGGYFSQDDVANGIAWVAERDPEVKKALASIGLQRAAAKKRSTFQQESVTMQQVAYMIRSMTRRLRRCFRNSKAKAAKDFPEESEMMATSTVSRSSSGTCPFPAFRDDDQEEEEMDKEEDDDDDNDDENSLPFFDGMLLKAAMLREDGRIEVASYHEHGDGGFVVAVFDSGRRWESELPNKYLSDGVIVPPQDPHQEPPADSTGIKRRPAAASKQHDDVKRPKHNAAQEIDVVDEPDGGEEEEPEGGEAEEPEGGEAEGGEAEEPEKPFVLELILVKAHAVDKFALQLKTMGESKNRTQLFEFYGAGKEEQVLHEVKAALHPALAPMITANMTVRQIPQEVLKDLRETAKACRDAIYNA